MKLVRKTRLHYKKDKSDKIYEVDLCELPGSNDARFLVNFRYGRRGGNLREGSKTEEPVSFEKATRLFDSVVVSKTNKGYVDLDKTGDTILESQSASSAPQENSSTSSLLDSLLSHLLSVTDSESRARIIWRLGEIGNTDTCSLICSKLGKGHWLEDYSIAWALGRIGSQVKYSELEVLYRSSNRQVSGMAFEAMLQVSDGSGREELLRKVVNKLPDKLVTVIENDGFNEVYRELSNTLSSKDLEKHWNEILINCYQYALTHQVLHKALQKVINSLKFSPGYFKGIRYIFKMSEFRLDGEMFGQLVKCIETKKAFFQYEYNWVWLPGVGGIKPSDELKQQNPRLAYSNKTRDYLRRRSWRSIKRLGNSNDQRYVDMAYHVLLAMTDQDGSEPRHTETYQWDYDGNGYQRSLVSSNDYGSFAGFLAFNHILYKHSVVYSLARSRRAWRKNIETEDNGRTDCYPHLWNQRPDLALNLLKLSKCKHVHIFARKVLEDNESYCQSIILIDLITLLSSTYESTCEFALNIAKQRLEQAPENIDLLLALLNCDLEAARTFGIERLSDLSFETAELDVLSNLMLIEYQEVFSVVSNKFESLVLADGQQEELLLDIIQQVFANERPISEKHAVDLAPLLLSKLQSAVLDFPLTMIGRLIDSDDTGKQILGGNLLVANQVSFQNIPEKMMHQIQSSSSSIVRGLGTSLLGKQSDNELIGNVDLLISLFEDGEKEERDAVLGILKRLAQSRDEWAETILHALLQLAFKKENKEGQAAELIGFVNDYLSEPLSRLENGLVWRLLMAKSRVAQSFGSLALKSISILDFSVKQWALLGHHANHQVRKLIHSAYNSYPQKVRESARDALRITDGDWEDSREFAFKYFSEGFKDDDWTPALVISLCDSVRDDVQIFGRETLQRFFKQENGVEYLIKLSQHPSLNVQLFVSSFLEEYAGGNEQRIIELKDYFCTVLSQVHKGRLCKNRIYKFLLKEALTSDSVARMAADLFGRISISIVQADRSALVQSMINLKDTYPDLELPIAQVQLPVKEFG